MQSLSGFGVVPTRPWPQPADHNRLDIAQANQMMAQIASGLTSISPLELGVRMGLSNVALQQLVGCSFLADPNRRYQQVLELAFHDHKLSAENLGQSLSGNIIRSTARGCNTLPESCKRVAKILGLNTLPEPERDYESARLNGEFMADHKLSLRDVLKLLNDGKILSVGATPNIDLGLLNAVYPNTSGEECSIPDNEMYRVDSLIRVLLEVYKHMQLSIKDLIACLKNIHCGTVAIDRISEKVLLSDPSPLVGSGTATLSACPAVKRVADRPAGVGSASSREGLAQGTCSRSLNGRKAASMTSPTPSLPRANEAPTLQNLYSMEIEGKNISLPNELWP